jgi:protein SCO1/2
MSTTRLARLIRVVAWGAVVGVAIAAAFRYLPPPGDSRVQVPITATIDEPFTLTTAEGKPFSSEMLKGRPYALFFGFTNCPDVCPTTLLEMSNNLAALGPDADRLTVLFVTVDPERDTAEHLKSYLSAFDRRIIGLTGNAADIALVAHAYHVFYEKVATSSGYTMNHTATVFLIDRRGVLASTTNDEESEAVQREKLRRLVARRLPYFGAPRTQ